MRGSRRGGSVRVKFLPQEHNTMSLARARPQTARSRDERTNHEATAPTYRVRRKSFRPFESRTLHKKAKMPCPVSPHSNFT